MLEKHRPNVTTEKNIKSLSIGEKMGDGVIISRNENGTVSVCHDFTYDVCGICTKNECPIKQGLQINP